jgi:CheY-like chemotaxis protein
VKETFPKNIEISTFFASDLWPLYANSTQVHQILLNLCVNARDAMPEGGHLTIAVDKHLQESKEEANLGTMEPGRYILLMLSDTGSGIPDETRQHIFEPFFSTKSQSKGTGLGLTTVRTIVEKHHGCINLSSETGSGTTFEVYLPTDSKTQASADSKQTLPSPTGNGELILIADDEQGVREMIASTLEASGYKVLLAGNGAEALSIQNTERVELMILDNDMPMMSGRQCLKEIKKQQPTLPVLLISGDIVEGRPSKQLQDANCIELSKPFQVDTLLEHVSQLIRNSH